MADMTACHWKISGMYCVQCEQRIERILQNIEGIENIHVSYQKALAEFHCHKSVSQDSVIKAIEKEGYKVTNSGHFPVRGVLNLTAIIILYLILQYSGILNQLAPSQLAQSGMGYGTLFLVGVVTSVHCIAMCGGISLSQSIADQKDRTKAFGRPFLYHLGRVLSYTGIGAVLGTVGYFIGGNPIISIPLTVQGAVKIIIGIMLFIMGLRLLGAFSWLQRFSVPFPKTVFRVFRKASSKAKTPFLIGLLNGFMPCGPLQAMWLIALASGSALNGAVSMLMFSLGTLPLMLGLGSLVVILGKKFAHTVQNAGAVIIAVMGLALFTQGGALSGILPVGIVSAGSAKDIAVNIGGVQIVSSELTPGSYPEITVQNGIPVKWNIHAEKGSINGCNNKIISHDLGIEYEFHEGDNIIEFTPESTGDISYSCWMGMIYGKIHVKE